MTRIDELAALEAEYRAAAVAMGEAYVARQKQRDLFHQSTCQQNVAAEDAYDSARDHRDEALENWNEALRNAAPDLLAVVRCAGESERLLRRSQVLVSHSQECMSEPDPFRPCICGYQEFMQQSGDAIASIAAALGKLGEG